MPIKPLYELFGYEADFEQMGQKLREQYDYLDNIHNNICESKVKYRTYRNDIPTLEIYDEYFEVFDFMSSELQKNIDNYIIQRILSPKVVKIL